MYLYIDFYYGYDETNLILYDDSKIIKTTSEVMKNQEEFNKSLKTFIGDDITIITKICSDNTNSFMLKGVKNEFFKTQNIEVVHIKKTSEFPYICKKWLIDNNKY